MNGSLEGAVRRGNQATGSFRVIVSAYGSSAPGMDVSTLSAGIGLGALIAVVAILALLRFRRKPTPATPPSGYSGKPKDPDWEL